MMPAADRKRALELHRHLLEAHAAGEIDASCASCDDALLLAQLVAELIRRGRRLLPVYHAAITAYGNDAVLVAPEKMLALREAAISAARAEQADDEADRKEAERG